MLKEDEIKVLCKKIRRTILDMSLSAGASSSHFGGGLSLVEIISVLFSNYLNLKDNPTDESKNRFILSKGHGVPPYYSALFHKGYIDKSHIQSFEKTEGILFGHPVRNIKYGIDYSTGSLGMGIGLAVGISIAFKRKAMKNKTYCIVGDGECNEGSVWEAAMSACHNELDNLTVILDNNSLQQTGSNIEISNPNLLSKKWESFGFETIEIDGHNIKEIFEALNYNVKKKPKIIVAKTIKGKGFSFAENNNDWHHKVLTKSAYEDALKELEN